MYPNWTIIVKVVTRELRVPLECGYYKEQKILIKNLDVLRKRRSASSCNMSQESYNNDWWFYACLKKSFISSRFILRFKLIDTHNWFSFLDLYFIIYNIMKWNLSKVIENIYNGSVSGFERQLMDLSIKHSC